MKITGKRLGEILSAIVGKAVDYVDSSDIIEIFQGQKDWQGCLEDSEEGDGMVGVLAAALDSGKMTEDEFTVMAKPHVARRIAEDLGAKNVTIEW